MFGVAWGCGAATAPTCACKDRIRLQTQRSTPPRQGDQHSPRWAETLRSFDAALWTASPLDIHSLWTAGQASPRLVQDPLAGGGANRSAAGEKHGEHHVMGPDCRGCEADTTLTTRPPTRFAGPTRGRPPPEGSSNPDAQIEADQRAVHRVIQTAWMGG